MNALQCIAQPGKLTAGLVFPIEAYSGAVPTMVGQEALATRAEELGFRSFWFRDVPFHDPSFGDVGQVYDPFVYMAHILNHTKHAVLATGSLIFPLRHPVHTAKSLASLQALSGGRIVAGIASGDRALEYPAFGLDVQDKGTLFRESLSYFRALQGDFPKHASPTYGTLAGPIDLLPKADPVPLLVTGYSGQEQDWIAEHADGWLYYPLSPSALEHKLRFWREALERTGQPWKPYLQSLYIDLVEDAGAPPTPIHLGIRSGSRFLIAHLQLLQSLGVNHVIFNLKYGSRPASEVVEQLGAEVLPALG